MLKMVPSLDKEFLYSRRARWNGRSAEGRDACLRSGPMDRKWLQLLVLKSEDDY